MDKIDSSAEYLFGRLSESAPVEPRDDDENVTDGEEDAPREHMHGMFGMMSGMEEEEEWEGTKYSLVTLNDIMSQAKDIIFLLNIVGFVVFIILLIIIMKTLRIKPQ